MDAELAKKILDTPINCEIGDCTIGEYLSELLITLLKKGAGFSGKRPFGDSGWKFQLLKAMVKGGFVKATFDPDGYLDEIEDVEEDKAFDLINTVIIFKLCNSKI
jgi:hypothetical protein